MSDSRNAAAGAGIGLGGALFALFVGLKLTGHIDWSWWWVSAPLWAPIALLVGIAGVVGLVMGAVLILAAAHDVWRHRARRRR